MTERDVATWKNRIVGEGEQPASQPRGARATHVVYALVDPRDNLPHYVGLTRNLRYRLYRHLSDKETNADKVAWIDSLEADGLKPETRVLARVSEDDVADTEIYWIARGRALGWPLTNATEGGEGAHSGQQAAAKFEYMRPFLGADAWAHFEALPILARFEICQITALATTEYAAVTARAQGRQWAGLGRQIAVAEETAERAVYAAKENRLEQLSAKVHARIERLTPLLDAYQEALLAQ